MRKRILIIFTFICVICGIFSLDSGYAATTKQPRVAENNIENNIQETVEVTNTTKVDTLAENEDKQEGLSNHDIGLLAAALATGLACIGAGIAVAVVASSAVGAISENPNLLGKTIIFAGLAEGIAIYGLIISIMILNKI